MLFSQNQIDDLLETIERYHIIFIGSNVGQDFLTKKDKALLKSAGIDVNKFPKETLLNHAFKFGVIAEALGDINTKALNYSEFKDYIKKGKFIPLTTSEEAALEAVKRQAYSDIKALNGRIQNKTNQLHQEISNRRDYEKLIEKQLSKTIADRESSKEMVLELGRQTGD